MLLNQRKLQSAARIKVKKNIYKEAEFMSQSRNKMNKPKKSTKEKKMEKRMKQEAKSNKNDVESLDKK